MAGEASKPIEKSVLWGGGRSPFSNSYGKMMMWFFLVSDALTFSGLLVAYGFARHASETWPVGEKVFRALPFLHVDAPLIYVALMTFILIVSSVTMVLAVEAGHRMDKKKVVFWMIATVIGGCIFLSSQAWEWSHFIHGSGGYVADEYGAIYHLKEDYHLKDGGHITATTMSSDFEHPEEFRLVNNKYSSDGPMTELSHAESIKIFNHRTYYVHGANMSINEYIPEQPRYANLFFGITGFHGFHVFSGVIINIIVMIMAIKGILHRRGHYEMIEKAGLYWHFVDLVWVFVFTFFYLV